MPDNQHLLLKSLNRVINPVTKRKITIGGVVYKKLLKSYRHDLDNNILQLITHDTSPSTVSNNTTNDTVTVTVNDPVIINESVNDSINDTITIKNTIAITTNNITQNIEVITIDDPDKKIFTIRIYRRVIIIKPNLITINDLDSNIFTTANTQNEIILYTIRKSNTPILRIRAHTNIIILTFISNNVSRNVSRDVIHIFTNPKPKLNRFIDTSDNCTICLENFPLKIFQCGHTCCDLCFSKMIKHGCNKCHICRHPLANDKVSDTLSNTTKNKIHRMLQLQ